MSSFFEERYRSAINRINPATVNQEDLHNRSMHKKYQKRMRMLRRAADVAIVGIGFAVISITTYAFQNLQHMIRVTENGIIIDYAYGRIDDESEIIHYVLSGEIIVNEDDVAEYDNSSIIILDVREPEEYETEILQCKTWEEAAEYCNFPVCYPAVDENLTENLDIYVQNGLGTTDIQLVVAQYTLENAWFEMDVTCYQNVRNWSVKHEIIEQIRTRNYRSVSGYEFVVGVAEQEEDVEAHAYAFFAADDYEVSFEFLNFSDNEINALLDSMDLSVYVNEN